MNASNSSSLDNNMLDIDFISSQSSTSSNQNSRESALTPVSAKVLEFIDATLNKIMSAISEGLPLEIVLKRVTSIQRAVQETDVDTQTASSVPVRVKHRRVIYTWPGRTLSEEWRFSTFTREAQFTMNPSKLQPALLNWYLAGLAKS